MSWQNLPVPKLEVRAEIRVVFNLQYLSQIFIKFNNQGVFWNPQDVQIPKLSLKFKIDQDFMEKKTKTFCNMWKGGYYILQPTKVRFYATYTCLTRLDTCKPRGIITNEFLDIQNPHLHSNILKIHQELPKKRTLLYQEKNEQKILGQIGPKSPFF